MDRYYTAKEVVSIIKDGWKQGLKKYRNWLILLEA